MYLKKCVNSLSIYCVFTYSKLEITIFSMESTTNIIVRNNQVVLVLKKIIRCNQGRL